MSYEDDDEVGKAQDILGSSNSNEVFALSKTIISNQRAKEILAGTFNEVIISEEKYDSEKIKKIYNELFYQISKKGKKSHTTIIEQSTDFVYPEINENLEDDIHSISEDIIELSESSSILNAPITIPQHPLYENGLIVQEGDPIDNKPINPGSTKWYLQQGLKREITIHSEGYFIRALRMASGDPAYSNGKFIPNSLSPYFRYLTPEDLNGIDDGNPIATNSDFNRKKIEKIETQYIYSEIDLILTCAGVEKFYKFRHGEVGHDYDLSEYYHGGTMGGYWWLDTEASCKVTYKTDIDPTTTFKSQTQTISIKGGGHKTITTSRDASWYGHELGGTTDPLDFNFYQTGLKSTEMRTIDNISVGVWKRYGAETVLPSITDVKEGSRLSYRIKAPYNSNGDIIDGGESHPLIQIIDGKGPAGSATVQGYPTQAGILNSYYNKDSNFGTKVVNNICYGPLSEGGCYGDLGQGTSGGVSGLFTNLSNYYYLDNANGRKTFKNKAFRTTYHEHNVKGRIYGQPIIKVNGDYCVFLESYRVRVLYFAHYDYNVFIRLKDGHIFRIKNKDLDDKVTGYKRNSNDLFNWLSNSEGKLNNPSIVWPGLKGHSINYENTDLDNRVTLSGFDQALENLEEWWQGWMNNISSGYVQGMPPINIIGNQIKDNIFNPKNGGSNYTWKLKDNTKITS